VESGANRQPAILNTNHQPPRKTNMKTTKSIIQAVCAGALLLLAANTQATVINGQLYLPLTIKITLNVIGTGNQAGTIVQKTATAKNLLNDLVSEQGFSFPNGTMLAIGLNQHVYAITTTAVLADLSNEGFFSLTTGVSLDTSTGTQGVTAYKAGDSGDAEFKYGDLGDLGTLGNNAGAFDLTGNYFINLSAAAPSKGLINETITFNASSFSGSSYWSNVDPANNLPMTANVSATATGKIP
jgi:hypothetical protein